jgi:murein DD-endopeptidase MepM/ murein hydrolase activator NlpD
VRQSKRKIVFYGLTLWLSVYLGLAQPAFASDAEYKIPYRVRTGDTFQSIGSRYGVSWELVAAMNNISAPYDLKPGQQIYIPRDPQTEIVVAKGDTLWDLSRKYGVDLGTLMVYNGLYAGDVLSVGQVLYVPDSASVGEPVITASAQVVASRSAATVNYRPVTAKKTTSNASSVVSANKGGWTLPIKGTVTSEYGKRKSGSHHGIDLAAPKGTTIKAAKGGTVLHSGWYNSIYGNAVIIDHGNGEKTLYGHCSKTTAKEGTTVAAGEAIAKVGSTGRSTGPHVHFEIYIDGKTVNPRNYLKF